MKFNSLKTRLIIVLLLMVLVPTFTIVWLAATSMFENIRLERMKDVGQMAATRHSELVQILNRANNRAKAFLSGVHAQCGEKGSKQYDSCIERLVKSYLATEGAIGASLHGEYADDNQTIGISASQNKKNINFQAGQLAQFSATGPVANRSYFIAVRDELTGDWLEVTYPIWILESIFTQPSELGLSGETFLADGEGYFVTQARYHSTQGHGAPISARPMKACLSGQSSEVLDLDYRDVQIIHGFRFVPEFGSACIMAHFDQEEAFAPLQLLKQRTIAAMFLLGLLLVITTLYLAKMLVKPITRLTKVARAISDGDCHEQADVDGGDELAELAAAFNHMTDRLHAVNQHSLQNEVRLTAILDNILDGLITINEHGIIESFNQSAEKIFGYIPAEVIGNNVKMLMPEPYHSQHDGYLNNFTTTGQKKIIGLGREVVGRRKDGSTFPMDLAVSEMKLGDRRMFTGIVRDITERKKGQNDFANISRLSQAVVNGADHLIITTDTQGVIMSFNRAAEASLGYRAEELIGKVTPAVFHDLDEVVHRAQELTAAGFPVEPGFEVFVARSRTQTRGDAHEWTYVRKDGTRFPVSLTVSALRDSNGEITAFLGIATDITERNLAIREKQADELRLNEAQHIAKVGSWDLDLVTGKLIWSDEIFNLFEIDKAQFGATYEAFLNAVHPEDREAVNQAYTTSLATRLPYEITHRLRMIDGRIKWVQERCTSDFDAEGKPLRSRGTVQDFTELRMAEHAAQESAMRTQAILDNVLDGIITITEQGAVESFNMSAEKIFGYVAVEVIGKNVKMLMPEPYHGEHDGYLHNFTTTGNKKIIGIGRQVFGMRKDGSTFPMDLAVSEMWLGDKRMFTGVVRDVTERVKIERMKSEFISTVSHELRTPLTSIRGSLGLIAGGVAGELPTQAKALVDIAHKNSERLILLVNDILDMEKIEAGKMEFHCQPIKLMSLLQQAVESNHAYAAQFQVSYELENKAPEAMVSVDANRLMQVLTNLLSNAAKFSSAGGKVQVATQLRNSHVRVNITDHGIGIAEEFKGQIFQKFSQADASDTRKKGGTGLGLSITKAIVEMMGGSIGFDSQPNVQTTFYLEFPVVQDAEVVRPAVSDGDGRKRVLICEDDHDIAALLNLMLQQNDLEADIAYDAAQAKQLLTQHSYAAMTLDLGLPGQSGIALIRELRESKVTASLPILVVSANAHEGRKELAGESFSVVDWISKPIDQKQLVLALRQALLRVCAGRPRVLHVEDDPDIVQVVNSIVGEYAEMFFATTLAEARRMLQNEHYDLVILDLGLPDGSGIDLLPVLSSATPPIPVMVFSAQEMGQEQQRNIGVVLLKSRTNNEQLLAHIKRLIGIE